MAKQKVKVDSGIGQRMRAIRKTLRLTQTEFAKLFNMSGPSLSELETGKYNPGFNLVEKLVNQYKVNPYYLLAGEGEMFSDPPPPKRGYSYPDNASDDVKDLLRYFEQSAIVHYHLLCEFKRILIQEKSSIDKELRGA